MKMNNFYKEQAKLHFEMALKEHRKLCSLEELAISIKFSLYPEEVEALIKELRKNKEERI